MEKTPRPSVAHPDVHPERLALLGWSQLPREFRRLPSVVRDFLRGLTVNASLLHAALVALGAGKSMVAIQHAFADLIPKIASDALLRGELVPGLRFDLVCSGDVRLFRQCCDALHAFGRPPRRVIVSLDTATKADIETFFACCGALAFEWLDLCVTITAPANDPHASSAWPTFLSAATQEQRLDILGLNTASVSVFGSHDAGPTFQQLLRHVRTLRLIAHPHDLVEAGHWISGCDPRTLSRLHLGTDVGDWGGYDVSVQDAWAKAWPALLQTLLHPDLGLRRLTLRRPRTARFTLRDALDAILRNHRIVWLDIGGSPGSLAECLLQACLQRNRGHDAQVHRSAADSLARSIFGGRFPGAADVATRLAPIITTLAAADPALRNALLAATRHAHQQARQAWEAVLLDDQLDRMLVATMALYLACGIDGRADNLLSYLLVMRDGLVQEFGEEAPIPHDLVFAMLADEARCALRVDGDTSASPAPRDRSQLSPCLRFVHDWLAGGFLAYVDSDDELDADITSGALLLFHDLHGVILHMLDQAVAYLDLQRDPTACRQLRVSLCAALRDQVVLPHLRQAYDEAMELVRTPAGGAPPTH